MKKSLFLISVTLLCASLAFSQEPTTQEPTGQSSATSAGVNSNSSTVQGCLGGTDGKYVVTQDNGTAVTLVGDTAKLTDHVGHKVQITGQVVTSGSSDSASAQNPGGSSTPSTATPDTFQVSDVSMVSEHCGSTGSTSAAPADSNTTVAQSDTASPTSDSASATPSAAMSSPAPSASVATPAPTPTNTATPTQSANDAPVAANNNGENLPQTASNLPLLALVALGFLIAGSVAASRRNARDGKRKTGLGIAL
jgi:hypothetical protein